MKKLIMFAVVLFVTCPLYASQIEKVIALSEPKTVKIGIVLEDGREGVCSGEFVTPSGIVLTCAHCFEHTGIKKVFIKTSEGKVYTGLGAIANEKMDLALVKADMRGNIVPFFKLGKRPSVGQQVIALGSPLGIQGVASVGYVERLMKETYAIVIHSAFVNPGNSGGPLVNLAGELVGVNQAILLIAPKMLSEGLFVAIDVETITEFLYGGDK